MKRRTALGVMLATAGSAIAQNKMAAAAARPIQLNCDLAVMPGKEQAFIKHFETVFRPVATKHEGYIDLKLLKIRQEIRGKTPVGAQFRFSLTYKTEAQRLKWVDSADHAKAWPPLEALLTDKNFNILVYDVY